MKRNLYRSICYPREGKSNGLEIRCAVLIGTPGCSCQPKSFSKRIKRVKIVNNQTERVNWTQKKPISATSLLPGLRSEKPPILTGMIQDVNEARNWIFIPFLIDCTQKSDH